jgi:hypothetical protein
MMKIRIVILLGLLGFTTLSLPSSGRCVDSTLVKLAENANFEVTGLVVTEKYHRYWQVNPSRASFDTSYTLNVTKNYGFAWSPMDADTIFLVADTLIASITRPTMPPGNGFESPNIKAVLDTMHHLLSTIEFRHSISSFYYANASYQSRDSENSLLSFSAVPYTKDSSGIITVILGGLELFSHLTLFRDTDRFSYYVTIGFDQRHPADSEGGIDLADSSPFDSSHAPQLVFQLGTYTQTAKMLEKSAPKSLALYPNPCQSILNYQPSGNASVIRVYDCLGRVRITKDATHAGSGDMPIDVRKLEPGLYFLSAGATESKFIVAR